MAAVLEGLGGPPNPVFVVGPTLSASACVARSCPDKGFFWIDTANGTAIGASASLWGCDGGGNIGLRCELLLGSRRITSFPDIPASGKQALMRRAHHIARQQCSFVPGSGIAHPTGLAWTPAGGHILFIESSRVKGKGKLILTGQLGEVMKESAQAAVTWVKSQADRLRIDPAFLDNSDLHIHVPAGANPKDGPSAGVAIATSLASLLLQRTVRSDVAMTGEISLRGVVMPVGGIKKKCVAAARAGIRTVILPARNRRDLEDIPESVRAKLEFVWAEKIDDVLARALEDAPAQRAAA